MADNLQSAYDEILEDIVCRMCGTRGMLPNGGFDYICPTCEYEGTLECDDKDEFDDEDEFYDEDECE